ncbi:MAG: GNAT family N-acetyltransferase [Oleispira sp.]|nr:GNAT family N-acetyltransferase [Oleispira sp.]
MEVSTVDWDSAQSSLRHIRQKVFIEEQQVPADLEWDRLDMQAIHFLGKEGNRPVACARLIKDESLGRVAVLKEYRGHGWGGRLIRAAEQYLIARHKGRLSLNAQANGYHFYFNNGYRPSEEMFWDANIPHLKMTKVLNRPNPASNTFILGKDQESHYSDQPAASAVWFQIGSSQARRELDIQISDLAHPVFNNTNCVANIARFIRESHKRKVRILINQEIPGLSEHPLLQLQQRMSSRLLIRWVPMKTDTDSYGNHILFDLTGHMRFDYKTVYSCFDNRLSVSRHKAHFEQYWLNSKELIEGRNLRL